MTSQEAEQRERETRMNELFMALHAHILRHHTDDLELLLKTSDFRRAFDESTCNRFINGGLTGVLEASVAATGPCPNGERHIR